ncbi:MAG: hypothetical protein F6K28_44925 [Microcoleus sp. SIO2G3]|nr:hypothetical protein [Microcoleus sp. SIO2G3]
MSPVLLAFAQRVPLGLSLPLGHRRVSRALGTGSPVGRWFPSGQTERKAHATRTEGFPNLLGDWRASSGGAECQRHTHSRSLTPLACRSPLGVALAIGIPEGSLVETCGL